MKTWTTFLLFALFATFTACTDNTEDLGDSGTAPPRDSGVITTPDAGEPADSGELDSGIPPARRLVTTKLFGEMPLDNAVLNPQFDISAQNWYGVGDLSGGGQFVRVQHRDFARTPVGMPVLVLPLRDTDPSDTIVIGTVMSVASPINASMWIGRTSTDAASIGDVQPSLFFMTLPDGEEHAYDLAVDAETEQQTLDGIVWQRYSAEITDPSLGIITIAIRDPMHKALYMHAPVVVSTARAFVNQKPIVAGRKLARVESIALKMIAEKRRQPNDPRPKASSRSLRALERRVIERAGGEE